MTERIRVQRELLNLAKTGRFYEVVYNEEGLPQPIDLEAASKVVPSGTNCNEVGSQFSEDRQYGRERRLKRQAWFFDLLVEFNGEVTLEEFEKDLMENIPVLPKIDSMRQATLVLVSSNMEHPVTQQGTNGTKAKFTFQVELGRN